MYLRANNVAIPGAALTLASKTYKPLHAKILSKSDIFAIVLTENCSPLSGNNGRY